MIDSREWRTPCLKGLLAEPVYTLSWSRGLFLKKFGTGPVGLKKAY